METNWDVSEIASFREHFASRILLLSKLWKATGKVEDVDETEK
jgi:hypothetical protein